MLTQEKKENVLKKKVEAKVRSFICLTAHPEGCMENVKSQIKYTKEQNFGNNGPKNVLVIGASTGYGLSSIITASFGYQANTLGVFFERPSMKGKPASAGWYNAVAFEQQARKEGRFAKSINGDAFSNELKDEVIKVLKNEMGPVDLVVYSLASPRRVDPNTGETYKSVLKPIGNTFVGKSLDTDKEEIIDVSIESASEEEMLATQKVMGGEDWELWMEALAKENLLAEGVKTVAYTYIGPKVTWPIYTQGTIGKAKEHLESSAQKLNKFLKEKYQGSAYISVNKALVTQASSAIPVVPLYISILFKVMKEKGLHEGCIEQICRLFKDHLYTKESMTVDEKGRIRIDDWEMREDVQNEIQEAWPKISTENLSQYADIEDYKKEFLKLFGFGLPNVDYDEEVEIEYDLH